MCEVVGEGHYFSSTVGETVNYKGAGKHWIMRKHIDHVIESGFYFKDMIILRGGFK